MNRAAAARPSGADAEPEPWERAAFPAAIHSDPIELAGAKRALKAFFFRLLPDIKVEDSFGEANQVLGPTWTRCPRPRQGGQRRSDAHWNRRDTGYNSRGRTSSN